MGPNKKIQHTPLTAPLVKVLEVNNSMSPDNLTIKFDLQPKEPFTIFALQIGGFQPLCFTSADILLMDRNVISNASNIISEGKHKDNKANYWWFSFINEPRYLLNPALAALEGAKQAIPSYKEFCQEFRRCCAVLEKAFPRGRVLSYTEEAYRGAYALVSEITKDYEPERAFLLEVAPLLAERKAFNKLRMYEAKILESSKALSIKQPTFSLMACLSCLYEGSSATGKSPGRLVIKPKPDYTEQMAHNALMDLYGLNLLIQGSANLNSNIALCTCDKGLLRFWCALKVKSGGVVTSDGIHFNIEFSDEMFPKLSPHEITMLKQRVEDRSF